jgi:hypothetical protein
MPTLLDPEKHFAVEFDHLPRVADYDDGSQHVLYWDELVRSMAAEDWPGPLPADPTPEESAAARQQIKQDEAQAEADADALRQRILNTAQSAVGVAYDQLTAAQLRALFGILLAKAGALDKNGVVRALNEWVKLKD